MARKRIIKTTPNSYGEPKKNFPRVTIRPGQAGHVIRNAASKTNRNFKRPSDFVVPPINFLKNELTKNSKESICFVVGGGLFLNGGTTIFVTTHYMDEAEHCQELAFIHAGKIVAQGAPDLIKTTLMKGQVLEISPDQPAEAMRLLKVARAEGRLKVDDVALYGAQAHIVAPDVGRVMETIAHLLQAGGVEPGQMDVISPSLEDVFLSCIR